MPLDPETPSGGPRVLTHFVITLRLFASSLCWEFRSNQEETRGPRAGVLLAGVPDRAAWHGAHLRAENLQFPYRPGRSRQNN